MIRKLTWYRNKWIDPNCRSGILSTVYEDNHARIQKVFSEGVQLRQRFFLFFWVMSGSKYYLFRAIIGPPAKRHLNGVSLAGRWWPNIECWIGSLVILRGSGPVLLRIPIFLYFPGGSGPPVPALSGSAHVITKSIGAFAHLPVMRRGCFPQKINLISPTPKSILLPSYWLSCVVAPAKWDSMRLTVLWKLHVCMRVWMGYND